MKNFEVDYKRIRNCFIANLLNGENELDKLKELNDFFGTKIETFDNLIEILMNVWSIDLEDYNKLKLIETSNGGYQISILEPIPFKDKAGFYHIPSFPDFVVNEKGVLLSIHNFERMKTYKYFDYTTNKPSYINYNLKYDYRQRSMVTQHRLLCLAFKPFVSDNTKLDVNHKDADRRNNKLDNLEWCSRTENMIHAFKNGLRSDNIRVKIRNVSTGEVKSYYSASELARVMNITETTVTNRIKRGDEFSYHGFQYKLDSDKRDWIENPKPSECNIRNFVIKYPDGRESSVAGIGEASRRCGSTITTVSKWLKINNGIFYCKNGCILIEKSLSPSSGTARWNSFNCGNISKNSNRTEEATGRQKENQRRKRRELRRLNREKRKSAAKLS